MLRYANLRLLHFKRLAVAEPSHRIISERLKSAVPRFVSANRSLL